MNKLDQDQNFFSSAVDGQDKHSEQARTGSDQIEDEATVNEDDPEQIIAKISRQGYQFLRQNQIAEAIECFRSILVEDSNNNYALVGLGDSYRKKQRWQEASQYYQRCLDFHPKNNYALFGLADCLRNLKQFHRAIEVWETYLTVDDTNVTVLTRIADAYRKVRNLERSRDLYLRVLQIESDNAYALIGLGHLYYDFKDYRQALSYWDRMHQLHGEHVDIRVLTSLGNCHRRLKTFTVGIPYFEKALNKDEENFYALFGLADCYRGLNQQDRSLQYWNRILYKDPNNKVILTRAGDAYRKMGDVSQAREYYHRALNIEFDTYAILGIALLNKHEGKYEDAAKGLENLLRQDNQLQRLYPELMECYLELRDQAGIRSVSTRFNDLRQVSTSIVDSMDRLRSRARL